MGVCNGQKRKKNKKINYDSYKYSCIYTGLSTESSIKHRKTLYQQMDAIDIYLDSEKFIEEFREMPTNRYKMLNRIGSGSFGVIYLCENKYNHDKYVLKKIRKIEDVNLSDEFNLLKQQVHPNIIKIYEYFNTLNNYYIVNEFCPYGELLDIIKKKFTENEISFIFYQILLALNYLNKNGITHRDIKLENLLIYDENVIKKTNETLYFVKLIDFGTAKKYSNIKNENTVVGTTYYMAPEILDKNYNYKCDLWSAGVILYQMTTNKCPFNGKSLKQIELNIKRGIFDKNFNNYVERSSELKDLIDKLLEKDIDKRYSAEQALGHPFFKKFDPIKIFEESVDKRECCSLINNLINFKLYSKFQQAILTYFCHNLKYNNNIKNCVFLFNSFNLKKDSMLTKDELLNGLKLYHSEEMVNRIIDELFYYLDGSNKGYVNYESFIGGCLYKDMFNNEENLLNAYEFFISSNKSDKWEILIKIKSLFIDKDHNLLNINDFYSDIMEEINMNKEENYNYNEFRKYISSFY